jgi:hypothetical protein
MDKKSVKPALMVMFLLLSCRMLFADVILDTIAKFVPANKTFVQGVIKQSTDYQFDNFILTAGYAQDDAGTVIPLLGRPNFEQVMLFSFVGYPVSIDSITENTDAIKIYYHLPDYKGSYQDDEYRYPPRTGHRNLRRGSQRYRGIR